VNAARRIVRDARTPGTLAAFARTEARFRVWSRSKEGRANRRRLEALRGRYQGRRCVIMGNGPSLLKCDLNQFAEEVTIVSNAHFLIWDDLVYTPTFLTVEDQLVAEDRAQELRSLSGVIKVFPLDLQDVLGAADERHVYVNFPRRYPSFPRFSCDLTKRAYWGGTVSVLNLQLACYLGCNPILLVGFDHNYKMSDEVKDNVIHSSGPDVNHIHPDYFGAGYRWHDPNVARMTAAYERARSELERVDVQVLNATVGGHLEVFERASLDAIWESG
jgi:hypothetical protein